MKQHSSKNRCRGGVGGRGLGTLGKAEEKNQCIQIKLLGYPFLLYFTRIIFEMINVLL